MNRFKKGGNTNSVISPQILVMIKSKPANNRAYLFSRASLVDQTVKNPPAMQETWLQSLGLGRSSGEGNGYPLQYFCLENSMDRGAWWATVHGPQRVGHNRVTNIFFRQIN